MGFHDNPRYFSRIPHMNFTLVHDSQVVFHNFLSTIHYFFQHTFFAFSPDFLGNSWLFPVNFPYMYFHKIHSTFPRNFMTFPSTFLDSPSTYPSNFMTFPSPFPSTSRDIPGTISTPFSACLQLSGCHSSSFVPNTHPHSPDIPGNSL